MSPSASWGILMAEWESKMLLRQYTPLPHTAVTIKQLNNLSKVKLTYGNRESVLRYQLWMHIQCQDGVASRITFLYLKIAKIEHWIWLLTLSYKTVDWVFPFSLKIQFFFICYATHIKRFNLFNISHDPLNTLILYLNV